MPGAHSLISPSSAKRWVSCTASVPAIVASGIKDSSSPDADLGTKAHDYAERVLMGTLVPKEVPDDFKHILVYTEYCQTLQKRWGGTEVIESKVPLFYHPEDTGTVDFMLISDHGVFIADYTNGVGEPVDAENNPQMAMYAMSAVLDPNNALLYDFTDATKVEMAIVQPRYHGAEPIKIWQTTVGELKEFLHPYDWAAIKIREALASGDTSDLVFTPGYNECRWCALKRTCTHRIKAATEPISIDVEVLDYLENEPAGEALAPALSLPIAMTLTDRQLLGIFANTKLITAL